MTHTRTQKHTDFEEKYRESGQGKNGGSKWGKRGEILLFPHLSHLPRDFPVFAEVVVTMMMMMMAVVLIMWVQQLLLCRWSKAVAFTPFSPVYSTRCELIFWNIIDLLQQMRTIVFSPHPEELHDLIVRVPVPRSCSTCFATLDFSTWPQVSPELLSLGSSKLPN